MPLQRRLPKLKGFSNALFKTTYQVVNLDRLGELFPEGGDVTVETLVAKGAVRKNQLVKVLGTGEISVAVNVQAHAFSATAKEKIAAAGGSVYRAVRAITRRGGSSMGLHARSALEFAGQRARLMSLGSSDQRLSDGMTPAPSLTDTRLIGAQEGPC